MQIKGRPIAVTGASGFLGSYIARALVEAGAEVVGVVRSPKKGAFLEPLGVTLRQADLTDRASLEQAFRGTDAVVSCAALWTLRRAPWEAFYAANVEGTENVYEAVGAAGVKRVIHISTFGVYRFRLYTPMDESTPLLDGERRQGGAYRATKALSEVRARVLADKHALRLTILRPTGIYGACDPHLMPMVRAACRFPLTPAPTLSFPLVYAGDVARAVVGALENDASAGEAYNTGGGDGSFSSFLRAVKKTHPQCRGITLPIPVPVRIRVSNAKAERDLGFSNRSFEEGLEETVRLEKERAA